MAQYIKQANIFGRIGSGIGQGLAQQLPQEIERGRLASGLQNLEGQQGLSPFQQFSRLAAIPGITPQMIESGANLLREQQLREAYKRGRAPGQEYKMQQNIQNQQGFQDLSNVKFGQMPGQMDRKLYQNDQTIPSNQDRREQSLSDQPAASEHPLAEKFLPPAPWNQAKHENAINEAFDRGLARNFGEASAYADKQRELYESAPEKYRQQLDYQKSIDRETDDLFDKELQTRLQKQGNETFNDIPGDLQLKIKKKARNSVATGQMTPQQAAEYYTTKALDLAKDNSRALEIANRDIYDRLAPSKKVETLKSLMHIAKNYTDMGADEEFYNFLTSDKLDENGRQIGMGLSPGGGAIIQYPRSPKVKSLIKNTKIPSKNSSEYTRAFADNLYNEMTPNDSFLAIARQMKQQDRNFDEYAFFDYLRENKDKYSWNKRLDREVSRGVSDALPNWRDIGIFPWFEKAVTND